MSNKFICVKCDKIFTRKLNFERHNLSKLHLEGKVKYSCKCCDLSFTQKEHLNQHLKTNKHKLKLNPKLLTIIEIKKMKNDKIELINNININKKRIKKRNEGKTLSNIIANNEVLEENIIKYKDTKKQLTIELNKEMIRLLFNHIVVNEYTKLLECFKNWINKY